MKDIKPNTLIIAGIVLIAVGAAHFGGLFAIASTEYGILDADCSCNFDASDNCICTVDGQARVQYTGSYIVMRNYWVGDELWGDALYTIDLQAGDPATFDYEGSFDNTEPTASYYIIALAKAGESGFIGSESIIVPAECETTPNPTPCGGLSPCGSDSSIHHECCGGDVWSCMWSNYDTAGYRMQWNLWDTCDVGCACDGSEVNQACWCSAEPTPTPTTPSPTPTTPSPTPTTPSPTPTTPTPPAPGEDWWHTYAIFGGSVVVLLLYFGYKKGV
ncbi:hypothetical protein KAT92_05720 [Candidatus Babeliales bacterium]|nr:hypothetical protein [Candidatus Babeliales bacterium]